jgi:tetratricopeptide (TPR) repeat protein
LSSAPRHVRLLRVFGAIALIQCVAHPRPASARETAELSRDEHRRLAAQHLREGRDGDAEPHLRALVDGHGSVAARLELARLRGRAGDPASGVELVLPALAQAPNSEELLLSFAELALAARAPERAEPALDALARMSPAIARHPYLLGVARMQLGDLGGAVAALGRAVELEPDRALAQIALGLVLNREKRYEQARERLERALRLEPGDADALAALAESEEGLGRLVEAERYALEALARRPAQPTAHLALGMVRMKQGRFAEARAALEAAVDGDPDSGKAHYQLGLAHARLGDEAASRRHLERYRALNEEIERRARERAGGGMPASAAAPPGAREP